MSQSLFIIISYVSFGNIYKTTQKLKQVKQFGTNQRVMIKCVLFLITAFIFNVLVRLSTALICWCWLSQFFELLHDLQLESIRLSKESNEVIKLLNIIINWIWVVHGKCLIALLRIEWFIRLQKLQTHCCERQKRAISQMEKFSWTLVPWFALFIVQTPEV